MLSKKRLRKPLKKKSPQRNRGSSPSSAATSVSDHLLIARSKNDLFKILDLSQGAIQIVELLHEISSTAKNLLEETELSTVEVSRRANVARSKVALIKKGINYGVSLETYIKVLAALGKRIEIRIL